MTCPDCGTPMKNVGGEMICPVCDLGMNKTLEESEWRK